MSSRNKINTFLFIIIVLAILGFGLSYPQGWNRGADWISQKTHFNLFHFPEKPFKLGLDLQGGVHLEYQAALSNIEQGERSRAMQGLRDVIERRVNLFGVKEPVVQVEEGRHRLIVELAGIEDVKQAIEMIGKTPYLEFREQKENFEKIIESNQEAFEKGEAIEDPFQPTKLTGRYLEKSQLQFDSTTQQALVGLEFNNEGAKIFKEITERNIGKIIAIYIDGIPISSPVVREVIPNGKAVIEGDFSIEEAKVLSRNLNAGALPVPINLISQQMIGASLGKQSLEKSLKAGTIGLIAVALFMFLIYRFSGLLAVIALGIYILLVLTIYKLIPVTLTLSGIAGFVLSIGMAVDANILIFERMKEEKKEGKDFTCIIEEGFRRAWPSIRDGNISTLITCFILFFIGTGFIQGFALTLGIGVLVSMFSAMVITKNFLKWFEGKKMTKWRWIWTR